MERLTNTPNTNSNPPYHLEVVDHTAHPSLVDMASVGQFTDLSKPFLPQPETTPVPEAVSVQEPYVMPDIMRENIAEGRRFDFSKIGAPEQVPRTEPSHSDRRHELIPLDPSTPDFAIRGIRGALRGRRVDNARRDAAKAIKKVDNRTAVANGILNNKIPQHGPMNLPEQGRPAVRTLRDKMAAKRASRLRTKVMRLNLEKDSLKDRAGKTDEYGVPFYQLDTQNKIMKDPKTGKPLMRPSDLGTPAQKARLRAGNYSHQQKSNEKKRARELRRVEEKIKSKSTKLDGRTKVNSGKLKTLQKKWDKPFELANRYANRDEKGPGRIKRIGNLAVRGVISLRENASELHIDNMKGQASRLRIEASFHENGNDVANQPTNKDVSKLAEKKREKARELSGKVAVSRMKAANRTKQRENK